MQWDISMWRLRLQSRKKQKMSAQLADQFGAVEIQVTPSRSGTPGHVGMEALIRIPAKVSMRKKLEKLQALDNVVFALQIG